MTKEKGKFFAAGEMQKNDNPRDAFGMPGAK